MITNPSIHHHPTQSMESLALRHPSLPLQTETQTTMIIHIADCLKYYGQVIGGSKKDKLNDLMEKTNIETKPTTTDEEWWTFIGIIIFAAKAGNGGITRLYDKSEQVLKELPRINLKDVMPEYRMKQLLKHFPDSFHGDDEADPWNRVTGIVNGFNQNRAEKVAASFTKLSAVILL